MSAKIKCILLDDELPGLTYLRLLCEQLPALEIVKAYNNPLVFVKESTVLDFDICIMDIDMPGLNGIEVAQLLRNKPVIFTTAYKEYAAEAFDLDAIDYIRKPIMKERLEKAVVKAAILLSEKQAGKNFLPFRTEKGKALLAFDQILLITVSTVDPRDKLAYMQNGESILLKNYTFEQLLEELPADYCRINRKDIIAFKSIRYFTQEEVTISLADGSGKDTTLILGVAYKAAFMARLK